MAKQKLQTIIRTNGEAETVDMLYYKKGELSSINIDGEKMEIVFYDEAEENMEMHSDYFDYTISTQPIDGLAFNSAVANVMSKPILDLMVKYNFPIEEMKMVNYNLAELFKKNEDKAYKKLFGTTPKKVTMNIFHDILD